MTLHDLHARADVNGNIYQCSRCGRVFSADTPDDTMNADECSGFPLVPMRFAIQSPSIEAMANMLGLSFYTSDPRNVTQEQIDKGNDLIERWIEEGKE